MHELCNGPYSIGDYEKTKVLKTGNQFAQPATSCSDLIIARETVLSVCIYFPPDSPE